MNSTVELAPDAGNTPFCKDDYWSWKLTWNTDSPDFTLCFHDTTLVYLPCGYLWIFLPFYLGAHYTNANIQGTNHVVLRITWARLFIGSLLIIRSLTDLTQKLATIGTVNALAAIVAPAVSTVSYLTVMAVVYVNVKKRRLQVSDIYTFIYWLLSIACSSLTLASVVRFPGIRTKWDNWSNTVQFTLTFIMFGMEFWPSGNSDEPKLHEYIHNDNARQDEKIGKSSPEVYANYPSQLVFGWFDGILYKGWKKPLGPDDLYRLKPEDTSKVINAKWNKYWSRQVKKTGNRPSILVPLVRSFGGTFVVASFYSFVNNIITVSSPNVLSYIIAFITNGDEQWKGYFFIACLMGLNITKTLTMSQAFYHLASLGLRARTALNCTIYKKALKLSPSGKRQRTVGETVNLQSIDSDRVVGLVSSVTTLWSAPMTIILTQFFLWQYLGPSSLAGLVIIVVLIPIEAVISRKLKQLNIENLENKDNRIKTMNEILEGIKVIKLSAWEPAFSAKVQSMREKEISTMKRRSLLSALNTFITSATPFFVALSSFATFVLVDPANNILTPEIAFVSLTYFNILRRPLNQLPTLVVTCVQSLVSVRRINTFLQADELSPEVDGHRDDKLAVDLIDASFSWSKELPPVLNNVNISVGKGDLIAVVGSVGSGKSSLLNSIAGELVKTGLGGSSSVQGSIAYVSQEPWIQNATLRYNVTFGKAYNPTLYNRVVKACALEEDLKILNAGDMTEIGERGINLSGGQKQRTSLARAVYSQCDVYLLDDPLASVDARVGRHIFDKVIGPDGLMGQKTRILVTNDVTLLPKMDNIFVMENGKIVESGSYRELLNGTGGFKNVLFQYLEQQSDNPKDLEGVTIDLEEVLTNPEDKKRLRRLSHGSSTKSHSTKLPAVTVTDKSGGRGMEPQKKDGSKKTGRNEKRQMRPTGKLMRGEDVKKTAVSWSVYKYYFKAMSPYLFTLSVLCMISQQGFDLTTNIWLSLWSDDPESSKVEVRNKYLSVYGAIGSMAALFVMMGSLSFAWGGLNAAFMIHNKMLTNIFMAPMAFFDTSPKGMVLNRFSKDTDAIDGRVPMIFQFTIRLVLRVLGTFVAISYASPIFIALVIPIGLAYVIIQKIYVKTARQLKRLESAARSPIYSLFSETLSGLSTIRAYGLQDQFAKENEARLDYSQSCVQPNIVSTRWLSVRLEFLGNIILLVAALIAVIGRDSLDAGTVGLSLTYASNITMTLSMLIRQTSQIETSMVSVERLMEYDSNMPREAPHKMPEQDPSEQWPEYGEIKITKYSTRYRDGMDLILKDVNCQIMSGEKIGVVGRTGAGKSSLVLSLFRIIEAAQGTIEIDNINISLMGLQVLRSNMTIIPQDPVLFSGSLRFNLDPLGKSTDEKIWDALRHANLSTTVSHLQGGLNYDVSEGGTNLSIGQKQLICLTRALLQKSKILILDEATASVDLETDDHIQKTIRREFYDCTVLTIAHRLNTIMDSNRIIVLDKGRVAEIGQPHELLSRKNGLFRAMALSSGIKM